MKHMKEEFNFALKSFICIEWLAALRHELVVHFCR